MEDLPETESRFAVPTSAAAQADVTMLVERSTAAVRPAVPGPATTAAAALPGGTGRRTESSRLRRCQLSHDIHHELGTIMILASLMIDAPDVGPDSRERARLILGETRWLDQLHRAYEEGVADVEDSTDSVPAEPIRLDLVAGEVVATMQLSTMTKITFAAVETYARADRLAFWRALRNIIDNAVRAAGPAGHVAVRIFVEDGWAVAQVDDDGPGFGASPPGHASLGLGIVQDLAAGWGGQLQIRRGALGGCCIRLQAPSAVVIKPGAVPASVPSEILRRRVGS